MAIQLRKQKNIFLTFKVLQFVNQLRRRVRPRRINASLALRQLGTCAFGTRALKCVSSRSSQIGKPHAKRSHRTERVLKSRMNNAKLLRPSRKQCRSALHVSTSRDVSGAALQNVINSIDNLYPAGGGLSAIAGDDERFLKHDNAPMFEGFSLTQFAQLIVAVQEAINIFSTCRSQYGDAWLIAQGLDNGLVLDETFIANYEHLLVYLLAELAGALARKAVEELLRGGHDKRQRKLLAWFSEFAEKPQPLSTSFPWTIKPSLAVLWGVCWMFYDRDSNDPGFKAGNTRVRQDKVLQHLDFPNVQWNTPESSDYVNFGLELIGADPQHTTQQPSRDNNVTAELDEMFQARNAASWESDLSPLDFRLQGEEDDAAIGSLRFGHAPPQLPDQNTYYHQVHDQFPLISPSNSYLPHNSGSPLTVYPHLGSNDSLNLPWHGPYASLPQGSPRHPLRSLQTPSITVTGTPGSGSAPPHNGFVAFGGLYQLPQAPLQLDTRFNYQYQPNMTAPIPSETTSMQVPQMAVKHERTSSINSNNMPTPTSLSGPRSPLISPTSHERAHIVRSPQIHSRHVSEDSSQDGDDDGSMRKNHSYKRAEDPPRNRENRMVCRYHECADLVFDRKCEWSKHMDKHDRPYKCNVKGCEKLQGFTYSGGLLRHEREVHKMHGGTKKALFCPIENCKRSTGAGFTRKENLAEHIRRVHRRTSMSADMHGLIIRRDTMDGSPIAESRQESESPYTRAVEYREDEDLASSLKRKRGSESGLSDRGSEDLRNEIKRLRQQNEEKDERLRQLERAVAMLQQNQTRR